MDLSLWSYDFEKSFIAIVFIPLYETGNLKGLRLSVCFSPRSDKALIIFLESRPFFFFKLYNIVLVLPNIEMNPPQVYTCSPS